MSEPFIQRLIETAPELRAAYDAHLRDNDELLSCVFLGDVTRIVVERCTDGDGTELLGGLLGLLERELEAKDPRIEQLVVLGFCENLLGETYALNVLVPMMGPLLFAELKKMRAP